MHVLHHVDVTHFLSFVWILHDFWFEFVYRWMCILLPPPLGVCCLIGDRRRRLLCECVSATSVFSSPFFVRWDAMWRDERRSRRTEPQSVASNVSNFHSSSRWIPASSSLTSFPFFHVMLKRTVVVVVVKAATSFFFFIFWFPSSLKKPAFSHPSHQSSTTSAASKVFSKKQIFSSSSSPFIFNDSIRQSCATAAPRDYFSPLIHGAQVLCLTVFYCIIRDEKGKDEQRDCNSPVSQIMNDNDDDDDDNNNNDDDDASRWSISFTAIRVVVCRFLTFSKPENKKNLKKRKEALDPFRSARKHTHTDTLTFTIHLYLYTECVCMCVLGSEGRALTERRGGSILALACTGAAVVGGAVGRRTGWRKTFISWHRLEATRRARSCFPFGLSLHPQLTRI